MRYARVACHGLLLVLAVLAPVLSFDLVPRTHADTPYSLNPVPAFAQEGSTIALVLTVSGATVSTLYVFRFAVKDPAGKTAQSPFQNYTTSPGQNQFSILVSYPSPSFTGSNSLFGKYSASVDQLVPVAQMAIATSSFILSIADNIAYERTQTVNMRASGYNASETVTATIRPQTALTPVFSQTMTATLMGIIAASWKIPVDATIDNYVLTLNGTSTVKSPPDRQQFSVKPAVMSITSILSLQTTYQRTETMEFSFQPTYPDGSIASTGVALLTLARPNGVNVTLTATYDNTTQNFSTSYQTSVNDQTGTWTASLAGHAYSDAYGNQGPGTKLTSTPTLTPTTITITVTTNTSFLVGQQVKFNATMTYPDGTTLRSGSVGAYLLYSGTRTVNDTVPMVFDTGLGLWIGTYTWQSSDTGGLWSLIIKGSDSSTSPNTGFATRAISLQNTTPSGNVAFPLYYFGMTAALIAAGLIGGFLLFRRRRVTHASLKIDLEAVRSEAGKIQSQDFFKSVKDQVRKDKDE